MEDPPWEETPGWFVYGLLREKGYSNEFIEAIPTRYGAELGWWLTEYAADPEQPKGRRSLARQASALCPRPAP